MEVSGQFRAPTALSPGKEPYFTMNFFFLFVKLQATGYRLCLVPRQEQGFSLRHHVQTRCETHADSSLTETGDSFPWLKREADHSFPSHAEIEKA